MCNRRHIIFLEIWIMKKILCPHYYKRIKERKQSISKLIILNSFSKRQGCLHFLGRVWTSLESLCPLLLRTLSQKELKSLAQRDSILPSWQYEGIYSHCFSTMSVDHHLLLSVMLLAARCHLLCESNRGCSG